MINKAQAFAASAHAAVNQVRKYSGEPYIVHPAAVAAKVSTVTEDPEVIAAAWLHDTVEDTKVTLDDVQQAFGPRVAELVENLTDVSRTEDGNRRTRKELDRAHLEAACPEAKTVKLADLIHNSQSIIQEDPNFARIFVREMKGFLEVLKEGDPRLFQEAMEVVDAYEKSREEEGSGGH